MKERVSFRSRPTRLRWALLLSCLILIAGGCATMSKPTIGISGSNDGQRP